MNDTTTGTNDRWDVKLEDAPQKSGVPRWVWGCGGGCMLLLVLVIAGTFWFFKQLAESFGPEAAWPQVATIMPYGQVGPDGVQIDHTLGRPAGITPGVFSMDNSLVKRVLPAEELAKIPLASVIILQPIGSADRPEGTGVNATLLVFRERLSDDPINFVLESEFMEEILSTQDEGSRGAAELEFQGRLVRTHHVSVDPGEEEANPLFPNAEGAEGMLFVDISGDRSRSIVLMCMATGEAEATIEALEDFLAPFRVWEGK